MPPEHGGRRGRARVRAALQQDALGAMDVGCRRKCVCREISGFGPARAGGRPWRLEPRANPHPGPVLVVLLRGTGPHPKHLARSCGPAARPSGAMQIVPGGYRFAAGGRRARADRDSARVRFR